MSLFRRWRIIVSLLFVLPVLNVVLPAQQSGGSGGQYSDALLSGLHWRDVGPCAAGGRSALREARVSQTLLFWLSGWRGLEDGQCGAHVVSYFGRGHTNRVDWGGRGGSEQPQRGLFENGRAGYP